MNKLKCTDIRYAYDDGDKKNIVLKGIDLTFESGKMYSIIGESGSGKTTLISLISALDNIQEGDITYNNVSIKDIGNAQFRLHYVNIVFQSYNLINYMTAKENVEIVLDFSGHNHPKDYAYEVLEKVGIDSAKANRMVLKLSGGEQQRVAVARAIATEVPIIVADEPTGNLDEDTEKKVMDLFKQMAKDGKIVIIVTHSKNVSSYADKIYKIKKGVIEK